MKKAWTIKFKKLKRGAETWYLKFQGSEFLKREWYPPWQNSLERANAKTVCEDLNAAFVARNRPNPS